MKRKEILIEFLSALGAQNIEWHEETDNHISGKVIYDKNDPEEIQDFCWHLTAQDVPNSSVFNLAKLINKNRLLSIDKITVNREELCNLYNAEYKMTLNTAEFNQILDAIEKIEVNMVDDGKETDVYFIHE